uniref:Uncharacterized protein n=1 Tax=Arundo donax TaxID=35708 RepID=A0A0A9ESB9_ARUDO
MSALVVELPPSARGPHVSIPVAQAAQQRSPLKKWKRRRILEMRFFLYNFWSSSGASCGGMKYVANLQSLLQL